MASRSRGPPRARASGTGRAAGPGTRRSSLAQPARSSACRHQAFDLVETAPDRRRLGQRRGQPFGQQPGASAGHRPVDGFEQAALPAAAAGPAVSSRLRRVAGSICSSVPGSMRRGRPRRGSSPFWVRREIVDQGTGGADLGPAEGAEGVERPHAVGLAQAALAGALSKLEAASGDSRSAKSRQGAAVAVGEPRLGQQHLARARCGRDRRRSAARVAGAVASSPVETGRPRRGRSCPGCAPPPAGNCWRARRAGRPR